MDQSFRENVIKSFVMAKGDITAVQATLADISLAIADSNSRHEKLVGEMHKLKIEQVKMLQQIRELSRRVSAKSQKPVVVVRNAAVRAPKKSPKSKRR